MGFKDHAKSGKRKLGGKKEHRRLDIKSCVMAAGCTAQMGAACAGGINIPACVSAIANGSAACKEHYKKCTSRRLSGKKEKAPVAKKADRRLTFTNCVVAAGCAAAVAGACTAGWKLVLVLQQLEQAQQCAKNMLKV